MIIYNIYSKLRTTKVYVTNMSKKNTVNERFFIDTLFQYFCYKPGFQFFVNQTCAHCKSFQTLNFRLVALSFRLVCSRKPRVVARNSPPQVSKMESLATIVNGFYRVTGFYCCKDVHLRCLREFWLRL